jgi:hypothetical protein
VFWTHCHLLHLLSMIKNCNRKDHSHCCEWPIRTLLWLNSITPQPLLSNRILFQSLSRPLAVAHSATYNTI